MTNREKATRVLAIIMEELNMPRGPTLGDLAYALLLIDPENEVMNILKPLIRDVVVDAVKGDIAREGQVA